MMHRMLCVRPCVRRASYLDRAPAWYDSHTRVFYIYSLGRYRNRPLYCYGDTNDLDAVEFYLRKTLPIYERIVYMPYHPALNDDKLIAGVTHTNIEIDEFPLKVFTCEDIQKVIQQLLQIKIPMEE